MTGPDDNGDGRDQRDDDGRDDVDERDDDGQDGGDGQDGDEWTPPDRAEWDRVVSTMRKRKDEVRDLRREVAQLKAAGGKGKDDGDKDDQPDPRDAELARLRETAARSAARAALSAAGFTGSKEQAARALRMLDLSNAEPDRNGDFDFDDDIEDLKQDFPGLFEKPDQDAGRRRGAPRVNTRDSDGDGRRKDRVSDQLLRQAGYR